MKANDFSRLIVCYAVAYSVAFLILLAVVM